MKAHLLTFFLIILLLSLFKTVKTVCPIQTRRFLHQPLFPEDSVPPPGSYQPPSPPPPPPPPPSVQESPSSDVGIPFLHEYPPPSVPLSYQNQPPPSATNGTLKIPTALQPNKPTKKVTIAICVGTVTLGMFSGLAVYLYKCRVKQAGDTQKLVGVNTVRRADDSGVNPSSFLHIGAVEPSRELLNEASEVNAGNSSPYHKLNAIKRYDRYRLSPELQPLPPLTKFADGNFPPPMSSSSSNEDEGRHKYCFH